MLVLRIISAWAGELVGFDNIYLRSQIVFDKKSSATWLHPELYLQWSLPYRPPSHLMIPQ